MWRSRLNERIMPGHERSPGLVVSRSAGPAAGTTREGLDDDHGAAAAGTRRALVWAVSSAGGSSVAGATPSSVAGEREAVLAGGAGEQAVVPDAVEAARQDVEQEAADELVGSQAS